MNYALTLLLIIHMSLSLRCSEEALTLKASTLAHALPVMLKPRSIPSRSLQKCFFEKYYNP